MTSSTQPVEVFGYGSLINVESLLATTPSAHNIRPAVINGWRREFSVVDPAGWGPDPSTGRPAPFWALNVRRVDDPRSRVCGVLFRINPTDLSRLLEREEIYSVQRVTVSMMNGSRESVTARLFVAAPETGTIDLESDAQRRYLALCAKGAAEWGASFADEFWETTYIGNRPLVATPDLVARRDEMERTRLEVVA